ncbi:hypothetical protein RE9416_15550 [Prescottella equi]|uniref:alpha-L-fucosidase n=1 Tax=Prescottella sp. D32 TaxID=3029740 RepID=UPI001C778DE6|nr:hypothetical protein RE9416_15550 [Prescottella equi]
MRERIDRYGPSVLWNDICWPSGGNLAGLFAYYYNTVEDGVVNDRWAEQDVKRDRTSESLLRGAGELAQRFWRFVPDDRKELAFPGSEHYDFKTPEYAQFDTIVDEKWESTRGVGHSFAANRNERPEDIVTATELIRSFVDIVSKNGNLLIGIGPAADGTVPEEQQAPLRGLGEWMAINRDAVIGSRPWTTAAGTTSEGSCVASTCVECAVSSCSVTPPPHWTSPRSTADSPPNFPRSSRYRPRTCCDWQARRADRMLGQEGEGRGRCVSGVRSAREPVYITSRARRGGAAAGCRRR